MPRKLLIHLSPAAYKAIAGRARAEGDTATAVARDILERASVGRYEWRTRDEMARYLGVSTRTVTRMVERGELARTYVNDGTPRYQINDPEDK